MSDAQPIGLMDWGIGGFSVYAALRAARRTDDVVYLSDAGNVSYGRLSTAQMRARFAEIGRFFAARDVRDVLVGCNAASSALAEDVEQFAGVRFHSIIPAGVRAAKAVRAQRIQVIGGDLTIASGVYQRRLSGKQFRFQATQPLSGFVERGDLDNPDLVDAIGHVIDFRENPPDALLLACTHYPALADHFDVFWPIVQLIDPAPYLLEAIIPTRGTSSLQYFTTGPAGSAGIAERVFKVSVPTATQLDLQLSPLADSPRRP